MKSNISRLFSKDFQCRERIGNSGSLGAAVDLMYLEVQDLTNNIKGLFGYCGLGGGLSIKIPVGMNFVSDWKPVEFFTSTRLIDFEGPATLLSTGASPLIGPNYHRWVFYGRLPRNIGVSFFCWKGIAMGFQTTGGKLKLLNWNSIK